MVGKKQDEEGEGKLRQRKDKCLVNTYLGMILDTDFPTCTICIRLSNITWNGNILQKVAVDIKLSAGPPSKEKWKEKNEKEVVDNRMKNIWGKRSAVSEKKDLKKNKNRRISNTSECTSIEILIWKGEGWGAKKNVVVINTGSSK